MDYTLRTRRERYVFQELDANLNVVGLLGGVEACNLEWSIYSTVRGSGDLAVVTTKPMAWQSVVVRVWVVVENRSGSEATPLITAVCRVPDVDWTPAGWAGAVDLQDMTLVLDEWLLSDAYVIPAGTVVTEEIRSILMRLGISDVDITPSTHTLAQEKKYVPAEDAQLSWLGVLNDLATGINYSAVWANARGTYQVHPYVAPGDRSVVWRFTDDGTGQRYQPRIGVAFEAGLKYNAWCYWSKATDTVAPVLYRSLNEDPRHPFSTVNSPRRRQVTRTKTDLEGDVNAILNRDKAEDMANQRTFTIDARFVPVTDNDAVEVANGAAEVRIRGVVTKRALKCVPGELVKLTLREVLT